MTTGQQKKAIAIDQKGEIMTEVQIKIIKSLARNDMNVTAAAEELHYHRNSLIYQLDKIYAETGLNPRKFYDLWKLLFSLMGGDLE